MPASSETFVKPLQAVTLNQSTISSNDEVEKLIEQLLLLQTSDTYNVADMAIKITDERYRALDALKARDAAVQRLSNAYISIQQKTEIIERLEKQVEDLKASEKTTKMAVDTVETAKLKLQIRVLDALVCDLREEIKKLKETATDFPPRYQSPKTSTLDPSPPALYRTSSEISSASSPVNGGVSEGAGVRPNVKVEHIINARNKVLATLPVPDGAPDEILKPIIIPTSYVNSTQFLASVPGHIRNLFINYRILNEFTTSWCPQREEHGYYLTPIFKCNTNPRVITAHRWTVADVPNSEPTDYFCNKDGMFYYAGVYKTIRMDDLTLKEWELLSNETTQALVKETLEGRKNTSPQNTYEVNQLYAVGALKVAVIALQCVGFNHELYKLLLEHARKCKESALKEAEKEKKKTEKVAPSPSHSESQASPSAFSSTSATTKLSPVDTQAPATAVATRSASASAPKSSPSSSSSLDLGLGFGLGSGANIWNTNVGVASLGLTSSASRSGSASRSSSSSSVSSSMSFSSSDSGSPIGGIGLGGASGRGNGTAGSGNAAVGTKWTGPEHGHVNKSGSVSGARVGVVGKGKENEQPHLASVAAPPVHAPTKSD